VFSQHPQSNPQEFPLNYDISLDAARLSALHTISFTQPHLNQYEHRDFCIYFTLETFGAETLVSDLALFIRTIGQQLVEWSVLGDPSQLNSDNPAHPSLQDIAYCWDGVACAYGVLQFHASSVSVMNIRQMFHQTSKICGSFCQIHRYEYLASGVFSDVEQAAIPTMFAEIEIAAQYVPFPDVRKILTHNLRELCDDGTVLSEVAGVDRVEHIPN
jgi:hypothetical protein